MDMLPTMPRELLPKRSGEGWILKMESSLKNKVAAWFRAGNERTGVRCVIEINLDDQNTPPAFLTFRILRRSNQVTKEATFITYHHEYAENSNKEDKYKNN